MTTKIDQYRNGGDGFILWAEENAYAPIYPPGSDIPVWTSMGRLPTKPDPETGRSYRSMWESQKVVVREALQMKNKRFIHRLIVLIWPRGEGKSFLAVLALIWKFVCWPKQTILLGANSKDQTKFVMYDEIRSVILNSPRLLNQIGSINVLEKEIRLKGEKHGIQGIIRCVSSFSGIFSNMTGFGFTEFFDMAKTDFYSRFYGSIRNVPNAFGIIDSTVSGKSHMLHQLHRNYVKSKAKGLSTKGVYVSYRCSAKGDFADYWHPNMTQDQLDGFKEQFPLGDFERFFLNVWSAGAERVFTDEIIEAMNYIGLDGSPGNYSQIIQLLTRKNHQLNTIQRITGNKPEARRNKGNKKVGHLAVREVSMGRIRELIDELDKRLWPVEDKLSLQDEYNQPAMATLDMLNAMGDVYDTDWALSGGIDRSDPMKSRTAARTIFVTIAKGLPGSRTNPLMFQEDKAPKYMYVLVHLFHAETSSLEEIKNEILSVHLTFNGIDMLTCERYGTWDLAPFCEEYDIAIDIPYPSYPRQKEAFIEFFLAANSGRFKAPPITVPGSKGPDILKEEAEAFEHDTVKKQLGSPEKKEKYGVQDDCMYAVAWAMYGARYLGVDDFKPRSSDLFFGQLYQAKGIERRLHG